MTPSPRVPEWREAENLRAGEALKKIGGANAHFVLIIGPPHSGRVALARRFHAEYVAPVEATEREERVLREIYLDARLDRQDRVRPFRAPHHTISRDALVGRHAASGAKAKSEFLLAYAGMLFLDELQEFRRADIADLAQRFKDWTFKPTYLWASATVDLRDKRLSAQKRAEEFAKILGLEVFWENA